MAQATAGVDGFCRIGPGPEPDLVQKEPADAT